MNAVLLRTLPVAEPDQLFAVNKVLSPDRQSSQYSWPAFEDARKTVAGRTELCAFTTATGMQIHS